MGLPFGRQPAGFRNTQPKLGNSRLTPHGGLLQGGQTSPSPFCCTLRNLTAEISSPLDLSAGPHHGRRNMCDSSDAAVNNWMRRPERPRHQIVDTRRGEAFRRQKLNRRASSRSFRRQPPPSPTSHMLCAANKIIPGDTTHGTSLGFPRPSSRVPASCCPRCCALNE